MHACSALCLPFGCYFSTILTKHNCCWFVGIIVLMKEAIAPVALFSSFSASGLGTTPSALPWPTKAYQGPRPAKALPVCGWVTRRPFPGRVTAASPWRPAPRLRAHRGLSQRQGARHGSRQGHGAASVRQRATNEGARPTVCGFASPSPWRRGALLSCSLHLRRHHCAPTPRCIQRGQTGRSREV